MNNFLYKFKKIGKIKTNEKVLLLVYTSNQKRMAWGIQGGRRQPQATRLAGGHP
jgi:hypothetical protein